MPPGSRRLSALNRLLLKSWAKGWSPVPSLDPDHLVARAARLTGVDDFGDDVPWRPNLDILTRALQAEAALSPLGRTIAHGQLVGALCHRLRAQRLWARHPEIAAQPITAPIIVLGQMRSGTTRVQRLLAQDRRFTFTRFYESWSPIPRGRLLDDRRLQGGVGLLAARLINPGFSAIHPTSPASPDEEIGLFSLALYGATLESQWRIPSFARHCEALDTRPIYAEFRKLLQTLSWLRGDNGTRPYILKVPQFTQDLASLLQVFPDARLICLDRPFDALVASSASLVRNQMAVQSDDVDPHWIGREWAGKIALRQARTRAVRARSNIPQIDLSFQAMNSDWRGEMRRVYRFLEMPLERVVEARMERYLARSRKHKLDRHSYSLAEFGLTAADLAEARSPFAQSLIQPS